MGKIVFYLSSETSFDHFPRKAVQKQLWEILSNS